MKNHSKEIAGFLAVVVLLFAVSCRSAGESGRTTVEAQPSAPVASATQPDVSPTPVFPDLQAELLDDRSKTTASPLRQFDFKNFTYPLPRGWQHPDGSDLTLISGRLVPVPETFDEGMSNEEKAERRAARRIGMSYVTTKFLDATGDGADEAFVILKVETAGAAIPQLVYVYEWKDDRPELLWNFRTGDRADGGLKDLRIEKGELIVELYGQDRFILGEIETGKITGDEEQLCCPTFFTRTAYKWNNGNFRMTGKRLTFSVNDKTALPIENMGDLVNKQEKLRKYR